MLGFVLKYFRKRYTKKYPNRFIEDIDYKSISHSKEKYEMIKDRIIKTNILNYNIDHLYFKLTRLGMLTIRKGYRWDGPSGPTFDTPSFMRSSGVHDILFQILRERMIDYFLRNIFFYEANEELERLSVIDGMIWPRHKWVKYGVNKLGRKYTQPKANSEGVK